MEQPTHHHDHNQIAIIMIPLPCQSHLNQLLHLSTLISSHHNHHLSLHFLGSATHNRQAKLRSHGLNPNSVSRIHFHDLPTPPILALDPDPNLSDKVPMHLWPATEAYMNFRKPVADFARCLSSKTRRVVIVYDRMVAEAVRDAVLVENTEAYAFNCLSAFNLFYILWEVMAMKPFELDGVLKNVPSVKEFIPEGALQFIVSANIEERVGDIHNTSKLIDSAYIDLMGKEEISGSKMQWAIRPKMSLTTFDGSIENRHECLDWLDKQPPNSVIYISFGTTTSLTNEEAREIALGLEQSGQKFVWVLRDADKADIFSGGVRTIELPLGFEDRVKENGIIVRDWAPQMEILAHESTGGFMSHCGWNSCMEGLSLGVPIAAWPMHSDQPLNAIFITEVLKTGFMVREWGEREEIVKASVVKSAVERMIASEEGDEVRKRAKEISVAISEEMEEGGKMCREMERFIAHISR